MKRILLRRPPLPLFALGVAAATLGAACARPGDADARRPGATLGEALRPGFLAEALRRAGGGHYHGTARFAVGAAAPDDGVTTTTDVWVDRASNYRVVESNDRDGGREVVLVGRELFVALRYGKMIHRVAEEPEPTRVLEEALGAPWAGWELAAQWAAVASTPAGGAKATEWRLSRATARIEDPATAASATGLRAWRSTAVVTDLAGRAVVDDSGALVQLDLTAKFTAKRDGHDLAGALDVRGALTDVGRVPAIARPPSEDLALRQRTVPEQHELLAGLPATHPLPTAPPKPGAPARNQKQNTKKP